MPELSRRWWAWIAVCGLVSGLACAVAAAKAEAERAPDGWTRSSAGVPFRRADLMGPLAEGQGAWSLDHFMGLSTPGALQPGETLTLSLQVPAGGEIQVFPAARWASGGPAAGPHSSTRTTTPEGAAVVLRRSRGGVAEGRRITREGEGRLRCAGALTLPGDDPFTLSLTATLTGFDATAGDGTLRCRAQTTGDKVVLRAGLRRVRVLSVDRAGQTQAPGGLPETLGWLMLGVVGLAGLSVGEVRSGADPRKVALTAAPLLLCGLTLGTDGRAVVESLRAPGLSPATVGLWVGLGPALALKALHLAGRLSRGERWRGLAGPLALTAAAAITVAAARPLHWGAVLYLGGAGAALGVVLWANVRTVRRYNLISLAGVVLAAGLGEYGLRFTAAGQAWSPNGRMESDRNLGWTNTAVREFQQLEAGEHPDYPIEGFPVAFPAPSQTPRIAAMGGSSTGGAYQNDDLGDFYPARLQERLGSRAEVLNQGVGGWTTFHIRAYLERTIDALDPDVLTLYVGHNDLLTRSRMPYKDLFARWQEGRLSDAVPLGSVRSYQGLRYLVQSLVDIEQQVAVPLDDARENLEAVLALAEARGVQVLLIPEAVSPDPGPLVAYSALMAELAAAHPHVAWLDGSTLLLDGGASMFLDDCHLTDAGHRVLAGAIAEELVRLGWVP